MPIPAVILASGYGSLRSVGGLPFPKVLETVAGEPMLARIVRTVETAGFSPIVVVINPFFGEQIRTALREQSDLIFVAQPDRFGGADAIARTLPTLAKCGAESFLVVYGDMPLWQPEILRGLRQKHLDSGGAVISMVTISIADEHPRELERYGRILNGSVKGAVGVVEPCDATPEQLATLTTVNPSLWMFSRKWLADHVGQIEPHVHPDGRASERHVPPLVAIAAGQGQTICEVPLSDPIQGLGVNNAGELEKIRAIIKDRVDW